MSDEDDMIAVIATTTAAVSSAQSTTVSSAASALSLVARDNSTKWIVSEKFDGNTLREAFKFDGKS